jgi:hypothetical protein
MGRKEQEDRLADLKLDRKILQRELSRRKNLESGVMHQDASLLLPRPSDTITRDLRRVESDIEDLEGVLDQGRGGGSTFS